MCIKQLPSIKRLLPLALLTVLLVFSSPIKAEDNSFSSKEFLTWEKGSQESYINISIGMTAFIASQIDDHKQQAACISDWYYPTKKEKNDFIRSIMRENSSFHPQAIILGVVEKQCGEF